MSEPLIVVTNDDGVQSEGLWAVVEAVLPLGEVLVVAPDRQWSGSGRSMPGGTTGALMRAPRLVEGREIMAFGVDASPALAIAHAVSELAPRRPALVISGVNFGANLGIEVTISGTVGAALEAAAFGIPALAVSLEMDPRYHRARHVVADYRAAQAFTYTFARFVLTHALAHDVDVLNINLPAEATPDTAWCVTRLSRLRYFLPLAPDRAGGQGRPGYRLMNDAAQAEPGSDIRATCYERVVSVTPLSLDLTARVPLPDGACAEAGHLDLLGLLWPVPASFGAPVKSPLA